MIFKSNGVIRTGALPRWEYTEMAKSRDIYERTKKNNYNKRSENLSLWIFFFF